MATGMRVRHVRITGFTPLVQLHLSGLDPDMLTRTLRGSGYGSSCGFLCLKLCLVPTSVSVSVALMAGKTASWDTTLGDKRKGKERRQTKVDSHLPEIEL